MKHVKNLWGAVALGFALSVVVSAVIVITFHTFYFKEISQLIQ